MLPVGVWCVQTRLAGPQQLPSCLRQPLDGGVGPDSRVKGLHFSGRLVLWVYVDFSVRSALPGLVSVNAWSGAHTDGSLLR